EEAAQEHWHGQESYFPPTKTHCRLLAPDLVRRLAARDRRPRLLARRRLFAAVSVAVGVEPVVIGTDDAHGTGVLRAVAAASGAVIVRRVGVKAGALVGGVAFRAGRRASVTHERPSCLASAPVLAAVV